MTIMPWPRPSSRESLRQGLTKLVSAKLEALRGPAEAGDANAQYKIGVIHGARLGRNDPVEALKWLTRAADQGHTGAQKRVGLMYARAVGVPQDYVEAYKWLTLAEASRPRVLRFQTNRLSKKMRSGQIATAELLVRAWRPKPEWPALIR
jgi:uncharacterized protein